MKREIKFRAWDKKLNYWYTPIHEAYKGKLHELLIGFRGDLLAHKLTGLEHESLWPGKFELMQFTGLLDRNNVEIYEGDILKTDVRAGNMKVIYFDTYASFMLEYKGLLYPLNEGADIEVIGNIYENPELL